VKLTELRNALDEPLLAGVTVSGLRVLVNPRPDWARTFAAFGAHVGSVDRFGGPRGEPVPEGLAHFLEHKLFEDAQGDVSDRFAGLGASTNAMTGFTTTTYIASTVEQPEAALELLLGFVQDPWFTDELVAKEQGIIAQEIRMYDDDPDWRVFFALLDCLYEHHPVKDNIAGTVESISGIDAATLRRCYELFYHPRNMCLAVSGALDPTRVAELVEADQRARVPDDRPAHVRPIVDEPERARRPRAELRMPVARPRLLLGIKERPDEGQGPRLVRRELCTRILLDMLFGHSSVVHERLYAAGLIDESFAAHYSGDATFGFSTIGGETDHPEQLEDALREALSASLVSGLDPAAFGRVRNKLYGLLLRALDSPEQVAFMLLGSTFRGVSPLQELELLDTLTLEELHERLAGHLREESMAVAVVRPREG
jgi:predicted Zn-dependent peptidase